MSLPVMRRGLSPEGRRNRDRMLGSLTIGLQGVTVHPTHRAGKNEPNFVAENVRRLHQIQTKCRERGANPRAPQPLRATPHPLLSQVEGRGYAVKRGSVERGGSAHSDYFSLSEDQPDAQPSGPGTGEVAEDNDEQFAYPLSPSHNLQLFNPEFPLNPASHCNSEVDSEDVISQVSHSLSQAGQKPSGTVYKSIPKSPNRNGSRPQSPSLRNNRPQSSIILEPIATKLTQPRLSDVGCNTDSNEKRSEMGMEGNNRLPVEGGLDKIPLGVDSDYERGLIGVGIGLSDRGILGSARLSKEARKMRMDSLMTKIKSQKPSCELEYNKHCKAIENQHRMLLDNSDKLSLYGSLHSSRDDLRSRSRSTSRPGTAGSVRSASCDRNPLKNNVNTGTGQKPMRANSFVSELKGPRKPLPESPQIRRKSTKESSEKGAKVGGKVQPPRKEVPKIRNMVRARSNLERSQVKKDEAPVRGPLLRKNSKEVTDHRSLADSNSDLNLNCTISSSGDFDVGDQNNSIINDPTLRLNIRPDSNATNFSEVSSGRYPESSHSVLPVNNYSPQHCKLKDTSSYTQQKYANDNPNERYREASTWDENMHTGVLTYENSVRTDKNEIYTGNHMSGEETGGNMENNVERKDDNDVHLATSTPLPDLNIQGTLQEKNEAQVERQGRQGDAKQPTPHQTLRRSQSLKNINQQKQQKQQQPQRKLGEVPPNYKKGKIPRYLAARREEERRAAEAIAAIDPACPPGHSPLPDHDRRNTLHLLRKSQAEVMRELATLPVAQDTLRVKRARQDLEDKLTQIEEGLRIFSQPKKEEEMTTHIAVCTPQEHDESTVHQKC